MIFFIFFYVLVFNNTDAENNKQIGSNFAKRGLKNLQRKRAEKKYETNPSFVDDSNSQLPDSILEKFQSFKETREYFKETLENQGITVDQYDSDLYKDQRGFYLIHLPLSVIDSYASLLNIHKPLNNEYVKLIEHVCTTDDEKLSETYTFTPAQLSKQIQRLDKNWKPEEINIKIPDETQSSNRISTLWKKWLKANAIKTRYDLKYTSIFNSEYGFLFENYYLDEKTKTRNPDFYSPAERSKVAHFLLHETKFRKGDSRSDGFGLGQLLGEQGEVFIGAYPLHSSSINTEKYEYQKGNRRNELDEGLINGDLRNVLLKYWGNWKYLFSTAQPMNYINAYFGEQISFYFSWIGFYNLFLVYATILGLIPVFYGIATLSENPIVTEVCGYENYTHDGQVITVEHDVSKVLMCPLCDGPDCGLWTMDQSCFGTKMSYIFDNSLSLLYMPLIVLWATLFVFFWRRKEYEISYKFNLTDLDTDTIRPQYRVVAEQMDPPMTRFNPITLKNEHYVPSRKKTPRYLASWAVVLTFLTVVFIAVVAVIVFRLAISVRYAKQIQRWLIEDSSDPTVQSYAYSTISTVSKLVGSLVSAIIIITLNKIYDKVAVKLTDLECHRTVDRYEQALVRKMFWFQFFNYYTPLVYFAFLKEPLEGTPGNNRYLFGNKRFRWEGCDVGGCTYELAIQMIMILTIKQVLRIMKQFLRPRVITLFKKYVYMEKEKRDVKPEDMKRWEADYNLAPTTPFLLTKEYRDMVVQYGFISMFAAAFPLGALLALLNNLIELRLDAHKYLAKHQRMVASSASGIGSWLSFIDLLTKLGVITNALVIGFTNLTIERLIYGWKKNYDSSFWNFKDFLQGEIWFSRNSWSGFVEHRISYFNTSCFYSDEGEFNSSSILHDGVLDNKKCDFDALDVALDREEELEACSMLYDLRGRHDNNTISRFNETECGYIGLRQMVDDGSCIDCVKILEKSLIIRIL